MTSRHTPGPWEWLEEIENSWYALSPGVLLTSDKTGTPWGDETDRANARLIAAAPLLLAALEMFMRAEEGEKPGLVYANARHAARVAIAKARGEAA